MTVNFSGGDRSCCGTTLSFFERENQQVYPTEPTELSPLNSPARHPNFSKNSHDATSYRTITISNSASAKPFRNGKLETGWCKFLRSMPGLCITGYWMSDAPLKQQGYATRWKFIAILLCVVVAAVASSLPLNFWLSSDSNGVVMNYAEPDEASFSEPAQEESQWLWDHNVYYEPPVAASPANPRYHALGVANAGSRPEGRNLLIAQFVGESTTKTAPGPQQILLAQFDYITSRPNRAYARQWGLNYVRFRPRGDDSFTMASFLKATLERQLNSTLQPLEENLLLYDAVAVLPPGAIVLDLDFDLLELIPDGKLLAIAGWDGENGNAGPPRSQVIFVNLRHALASVVLNQWWDALESARSQQRVENNIRSFDESGQVLRIIESFLIEGEDLASLIHRLSDADGGFLLEQGHPDSGNTTVDHPTAPYCVQSFAPSDLSSFEWSSISARMLSDPEATRAALQTTVDAVCYRFYPKCEIL